MVNPLRILAETQLNVIKAQALKCDKCPLQETRTQVVFGIGNAYQPDIMFIGEAPGENEDLQGEPFVGAAGQLLDKLLSALGISRKEVFIDNIVKCRPPNNRKPTAEEIAHCLPYLKEEIKVIKPKTIVCLGATAAQSLLKSKDSIKKMRGKWMSYQGIPVRVTYHPAWLLRLGGEDLSDAKAKVWDDMQEVMKHLKERKAADEAVKQGT